MSSGWDPGLEEMPPGVKTAIRDRVLATADGLGPEAVLWLAAPPLWTLGIAEAAGFPASPLIEFVRRACDAGWCKARGPLLGDPPPDLVFWMPDEGRRAAMDELRIRGGVAWIAALQRRVAVSVAQVTGVQAAYSTHGPPATPPWDEVPGALSAWAELMVSSSQWSSSGSGAESSSSADLGAAADASRLLFEWTQEAVASGDLGRAQDLVAAGEAIAGVLAGPAEQALSQAQRLVTLGLRRRQAERALGRYLDRPELSDAVARLLERDATDERRWALHLRGAGGVGKTMLITYLASGRYAADRGMRAFPAVRADFDYISPDYPVRRPVQLLLELAEELVLHTAVNARADRALVKFRALAARAHEAASGRREAGGPPRLSEESASAVDSFGDVLAELGNVLLVLDTCEELAKADLGDPATPAVRATLDIIERLHSRAPSARVLFAGRRPLPARPYLAVQEVDGFTQEEARRYLAASRGRPLPPELAEEMIRQSPAADGLVPPPGRLPERVSPFDLALYAAWAEDDPDLDVAEVRRGSDAYVESRIISRLGDPLVVQALPLLAAAGRCRVATLAEVLDCDPAVLGRGLAEQEWILAGGDPVTHVAARPALARSLRRYFGSDERRTEFAARTAALGAALLTHLQQVPLAEIDPDEMIAALRLAEPGEAAALWDSIADRATDPPGHWGIVLGLTRRILREWDEEEWPTTEALRATVTAAHIAASRRDSALFDASGPWRTVLSWARRHPDPGAGQRLLARAAFGLLASPLDGEDTLPFGSFVWGADSRGEMRVTILLNTTGPDSQTLAFPLDKAPELGAAVIDVAHRLLEAGSSDEAGRLAAGVLAPDRPGTRAVTRQAGSPAALGPRLRAWALVVRSRALAGTEESDEAAARDLAEAERLAASTDLEPSWPDWVPPADLLARVRIERGLIAPPDDLAVLDEWESYAAEHLGTIDGERLASLCLRIRLRHGVVDAARAERWETADGYVPDLVPSCTAHDLVPPLFVSVAQAWFSAGEAERAMALLDRRRREALGTRLDEVTVRYTEAATVAIVRRLRLAGRQSVLTRLADIEQDSGERNPAALGDVRLQAWRAQAVTYGTHDPYSPFVIDDPEIWHAWWQSLGPGPFAVGYLLNGPARRRWRPAITSADVADIQADRVEVEQLAPRISSSRIQSALADWVKACDGWLAEPAPPPSARSADLHREVRAAMRMAALAGENFGLPPRVPSRLLAEMAFEEAELTALRLPRAATRLFHTAALAYQEADDPLGEYLARLSVLLAGPLPDGPAEVRSPDAGRRADAAFDKLSRRLPAVARAIGAGPEGTGPWRSWTPAEREATAWAQAVSAAAVATLSDSDYQPAELAFPPKTTPGPGGAGAGSSRQEPVPHTAVPTRRRGHWYAVVSVALAVLACVAAEVDLVLPPAINPSGVQHPLPGIGTSSVPWIAALLAALAVLTALLGWYTPKVMRLAAGRGIGASRLGTLHFDALVYAGSGDDSGGRTYASSLLVGVRPWRTAPRRARAALWFLIPAVRLARRFRSGGSGYYASADMAPGAAAVPPRLEWTAPRPAAGKAWWRRGRGSAPGIIRVSSTESYVSGAMTAPWERMLADSLSPDAAGRIGWIRLVQARVLPLSASRPDSMLVGPLAWTRSLTQYYTLTSRYSASGVGPPEGGLLHVIGRAVATSAGPAMDVAGSYAGQSAAESGPLDATELKRPQPAMVILQAEPASADTTGDDPPDDQAEKLRLGAALAADGIPAVLLLPVLPAGIADELAQIITTHIGLQQDGDARAQVLLTQVREAVAPHVPPPVLDDIVLFLNVARYRS